MDTHVRIVELLENEERFCLATVLDSKSAEIRPGRKAIVLHDGTVEGSLGSAQLDSNVAGLVQKAFKENKSQMAEMEAGVKVFLDIISPDEELILCGAGHIAVPLARFARRLGFRVTVIDDRSDFASASRFPDCSVIAENFTVALRDYHFSPATYVVVITRGHEHDADCLIEILRKKRLKDVFTPIGLPIGAESPEEIALSIVSELVCVRRKGPAQARALRNAVGIDL